MERTFSLAISSSARSQSSRSWPSSRSRDSIEFIRALADLIFELFGLTHCLRGWFFVGSLGTGDSFSFDATDGLCDLRQHMLLEC